MKERCGLSPEELRNVALKAAREAAALLRDYAMDPSVLKPVGVGAGGDASIAADRMSEEYVVEVLRAEGLKFKLVSEESGVIACDDYDVIAVLDPLDGSTNYTAGVPYAAVSLAFVDPKGDGLDSLLAGAVAPVFWGPAFSFSRGEGAFVDSSPLKRLESKRILSIYTESDVFTAIKKYWRLTGKTKIRCYGAAALDICLVALGVADAFIDFRGRLRNVDIAAAAGVALESGCVISDVTGAPLRFTASRIERVGTVLVARDKETHEKLVEAIKSAECC